MSSEEVAALYGVSVMTVHRWVAGGLFDVAPERLNGKGPYVFDREATVKQHQRETEKP